MRKKINPNLEINLPNLNDLLSILESSKSGKALRSALESLDKLILKSEHDRKSLFESRIFLDKLTRSTIYRIRASLNDSYRKRFENFESFLKGTLSKWEKMFAATFPVFLAWLNDQRSKGLIIRNISESSSSQKVSEFVYEKRVADLLKDISAAVFELGELIKAFTPTLEEAFGGEFDSEVVISEREPTVLTETNGVNEELFGAAREKFNYLTKKLIPRLSQLGKDLPEHADDINGRITAVTTSRVYRNFVLLLSRRDSKFLNGDDDSYDEWF